MYLSQAQQAQFAQRRQALLDKLPAHSSVCIFAGSEQTRSNDTEYLFRPNSYFYYLTGFCEPDGCLVLGKGADSSSETLFCLAKDQTAEIWHGRRLGADNVSAALGISDAYPLAELPEVLAEKLAFQESCGYLSTQHDAFEAHIEPVIMGLRKRPKTPDAAPSRIFDVSDTLDSARMVKSESELAIMRQGCKIAAQAHIAAMQVCQVGQSEATLEAILHAEFALRGARTPAYNSIVGAGDNACILHYTVNNCPLQDGDLVLIDAGCEYQGYAADITRTFPINGRFSEAQAALYDIVLAAQAAAIARCRAGVLFADMQQTAVEVLVSGLLDLGILTGTLADNIAQETYRAFYMHGIGHYLGLDVHDAGIYKRRGEDQPIPANSVITIEPGLYIAPDADVPEAYRGIGIRIEDDVVVQIDGCDILTKDVPKTRSQNTFHQKSAKQKLRR
jgi:Xaa-Pro aminopeptidase